MISISDVLKGKPRDYLIKMGFPRISKNRVFIETKNFAIILYKVGPSWGCDFRSEQEADKFIQSRDSIREVVYAIVERMPAADKVAYLLDEGTL